MESPPRERTDELRRESFPPRDIRTPLESRGIEREDVDGDEKRRRRRRRRHRPRSSRAEAARGIGSPQEMTEKSDEFPGSGDVETYREGGATSTNVPAGSGATSIPPQTPLPRSIVSPRESEIGLVPSSATSQLGAAISWEKVPRAKKPARPGKQQRRWQQRREGKSRAKGEVRSRDGDQRESFERTTSLEGVFEGNAGRKRRAETMSAGSAFVASSSASGGGRQRLDEEEYRRSKRRRTETVEGKPGWMDGLRTPLEELKRSEGVAENDEVGRRFIETTHRNRGRVEADREPSAQRRLPDTVAERATTTEMMRSGGSVDEQSLPTVPPSLRTTPYQTQSHDHFAPPLPMEEHSQDVAAEHEGEGEYEIEHGRGRRERGKKFKPYRWLSLEEKLEMEEREERKAQMEESIINIPRPRRRGTGYIVKAPRLTTQSVLGMKRYDPSPGFLDDDAPSGLPRDIDLDGTMEGMAPEFFKRLADKVMQSGQESDAEKEESSASSDDEETPRARGAVAGTSRASRIKVGDDVTPPRRRPEQSEGREVPLPSQAQSHSSLQLPPIHSGSKQAGRNKRSDTLLSPVSPAHHTSAYAASPAGPFTPAAAVRTSRSGTPLASTVGALSAHQQRSRPPSPAGAMEIGEGDKRESFSPSALTAASLSASRFNRTLLAELRSKTARVRFLETENDHLRARVKELEAELEEERNLKGLGDVNF